ncbi:hypothetical protein FRACA_300030 [Frankia canadensis]|uniref:Uncharacterized protein n=1 Tax=Frankia canadensis TaxID=1836972 RepID=A0A2I2KTY1_9ACTN|nr:hypothetical protein FRACA_300030 [Frankia canadensis]SOU56424.1 hypothetical protein FRACA_300030 [Frankia canadensis]
MRPRTPGPAAGAHRHQPVHPGYRRSPDVMSGRVDRVSCYSRLTDVGHRPASALRTGQDVHYPSVAIPSRRSRAHRLHAGIPHS